MRPADGISSKSGHGSLRLRLLLTFGFGSIVLFVLIRLISFTGLPWLNIGGERDQFIMLAEQNLQAVADEKREAVQQWFQERLGDGRTAAAFPAFRHHAISLSRAAQKGKGSIRQIWGSLATNEHYRAVFDRIRIIDRTYGQYDVVSLVELTSGICIVSSDEADAGSIAPYARELVADRSGSWSEKIYFSRDEDEQKTFLYMAFAVRDTDEKAVAALVFRISPETFLMRLFHESPALGASGEIILIDMQRMLLTPLKYPLPDGSTAQPLSYALQTKPAEVAALGIDSLFFSRDYRGIPVLVAVRHARITPDFGFGLIVKRDESEVHEPIRQSLMITGLITGLGLLLLLAAGIVAAGSIARPIEHLTETVRRIAAGDLAARAMITGKDEIAELAGAFNSMAGRIQQSHENLEEQVRERTAELEANVQLLRVEMEERRTAEAGIRASEERFRQLAENIPEAFWIVSSDWQTVHYISPAFERIWGRRCEDLYERPMEWFDAILTEDQAAVLAAVPHRIEQGMLIAFPDYRIRRPDGSVRWIAARALPIAETDGSLFRVAGIAEDITDRKMLEHQLVQAQKMESVGRLAGGVAHDFNNMLAVIFIALELVRMHLSRMHLSPDDPVHEQLQEIEKAAIRSRDITRQLLAFSRKQLIAPRSCDINTLVGDLLKSLSRLIGEDIELRFIPGEQTGLILIDPSQIDQVLVNLAVNARDAMPHGGTLTIETAAEEIDAAYCEEHPDVLPGRYVSLSVSDTGLGMDKQTLEHIFEPFFTTKDVGKGTGLGLAMIYGVVKQNNGFITVYSEVGSGTLFKLYFPCMEASKEVPELSEPMQPEKGDGRILLVEDDEILCRVIKSTLGTLGYEVTVAHAPAEALDVLERDSRGYALLLTDVVMPGMNGRELAERILSRCPGIKVIFMSGYTSDAVVHRGVLEEGVPFIQKPFSVMALASRIREALGK